MSPESPIPLHLEVPRVWFLDATDGHRHRRMYTTLLLALTQYNFAVKLIDLPFDTLSVPRSAPEGGVLFSYHSQGEAPNVWRIKESPVFGYYTYDRLGFSGWSSLSVERERLAPLIDAIDLGAASDHVVSVGATLRDRNLSKYDQSAEPFVAPGPYVFLPMQTIDDPVARFARIGYLEVLAAAAAIARERQRHLVVKRHPRCEHPAVTQALREACRDNPFVTVTNASIHPLIAGCSAVLVGNSGVGLEALFYDKPVYSFSASEYDLAVRPIAAVAEIAQAFADSHASDGGRARRFLHYYLTRACFHMDSAQSMRPFIDATLAPLGGAAAARTVTDAGQQLMWAQSALENTRRELVKAQETTRAFQKMAEEAVAMAQSIAAQRQEGEQRFTLLSAQMQFLVGALTMPADQDLAPLAGSVWLWNNGTHVSFDRAGTVMINGLESGRYVRLVGEQRSFLISWSDWRWLDIGELSADGQSLTCRNNVGATFVVSRL